MSFLECIISVFGLEEPFHNSIRTVLRTPLFIVCALHKGFTLLHKIVQPHFDAGEILTYSSILLSILCSIHPLPPPGVFISYDNRHPRWHFVLGVGLVCVCVSSQCTACFLSAVVCLCHQHLDISSAFSPLQLQRG